SIHWFFSRRQARCLPVASSHSRTAPSRPPAARILPSGLKATLLIRLVSPRKKVRAFRVARFHTFTSPISFDNSFMFFLTSLRVLGETSAPSCLPPADASALPSGLSATE